jgi:hypothetical protein|tara:strand:- start:805 stop:918 length:114 start_codon:yes stop_codon:yes gene_type:complete
MTIDFLWGITWDELGMGVAIFTLIVALIYTWIFIKDR